MDLAEWMAETPPGAEGAMLAAWERISGEYAQDDAMMREAHAAALGLARSFNNGAVSAQTDGAVRMVSDRLTLTALAHEVAKVQAKAQAAMLLYLGVPDTAAAQALGVARMTVLRWFGRGTR